MAEIIVLTSGRGSDPMAEFGAEANPGQTPVRADVGAQRPVPLAMSAVAPTAGGHGRFVATIVVLGLLALGQLPFVALWAKQARPAAPAPIGTLAVETQPSGVEIRVDGTSVGRAPLRVSVPAGRRTLQLSHGGVERSLAVLVGPGETLRHRFEFLPGPPIPEIARSAPVVTKAVQASTRQIPPGSLSGWVKVDAAAPLRVFEAGAFLGTTDIDRLMLPVGEHVLELRSDELRFSTQHTLTVSAGATAIVQVRLPSVPLSINAKPWAEAWVDGERVGDTPIGNLLRPIGRHEILLRHPQFGERRESVLLTLQEPAHVSVDLRQGR
jgi:hypothetical protein